MTRPYDPLCCCCSKPVGLAIVFAIGSFLSLLSTLYGSFLCVIALLMYIPGMYAFYQKSQRFHEIMLPVFGIISAVQLIILFALVYVMIIYNLPNTSNFGPALLMLYLLFSTGPVMFHWYYFSRNLKTQVASPKFQTTDPSVTATIRSTATIDSKTVNIKVQNGDEIFSMTLPATLAELKVKLLDKMNQTPIMSLHYMDGSDKVKIKDDEDYSIFIRAPTKLIVN